MTEPTSLSRLAALAGVLPSYRDAWGHERIVSEATTRALLSAMGLRCDTPDEVTGTIQAIEETPFRKPLAPVLVAKWRRGDRLQIPIALSAANATRPIAWRFELESGKVHEGAVRFSELPLFDHRAVEGKVVERRVLTMRFPIGIGYHTFRLFLRGRNSAEEPTLPVIVVPPRCYLPKEQGTTAAWWGIALQLYGVRSKQNWGIGDFTDLATLTRMGGELGASAIGLNPLHALFPANPAHASPYSPSHREFLNTLYLDVTAIEDFSECQEAQEQVGSPQFRTKIDSLRTTSSVHYEEAAGLKRPLLELLYQSFLENHLGGDENSTKTARAAAFRYFQRKRGQSLQSLGLFQALSEQFAANGRWAEWPAPYRDPASPAVLEFAASHRNRIEFFQYLQWQADLQLTAASEAARETGMVLGLYHDLALAPDGNGAEAWANQSTFAKGVTLGAPPDDWNHNGQNWGLPPYNPPALRAVAFDPFRAVIRANMDHAGALRMDHAMGLERMYWIPDGAEPQDGGYVRYPVDELIGVLALESQRQACVVIGEDLGTLPDGFQQRMRDAAMLSYRLLYFSHDKNGAFLKPRRYPALAAVAVNTHDLATLAGFWQGRDLEVRANLGLYPSERAHQDLAERRELDRRALIQALKEEDLLPGNVRDDQETLSFDVVVAVYRFLSRSPARLLLLSLEDVIGETEQINMPGTVSEYPNWKRKMRMEIEDVLRDARMIAITDAIREGRQRSLRKKSRRHSPDGS